MPVSRASTNLSAMWAVHSLHEFANPAASDGVKGVFLVTGGRSRTASSFGNREQVFDRLEGVLGVVGGGVGAGSASDEIGRIGAAEEAVVAAGAAEVVGTAVAEEVILARAAEEIIAAAAAEQDVVAVI